MRKRETPKAPEQLTAEDRRREKRRGYNQNYYKTHKQKRERESGRSDERKVPWHGRLPVTFIGRLQRLVNEGIATGRYPWKTISDCMVSNTNKGLLSVKDDPFIEEMKSVVELEQHIHRLRRIRQESQTMLAVARQEITEMLGIKANEAARSTFHATMEAAHRMPPTIWRDWFLTEFQKSFPDLARKEAKGMRLTELKLLPKSKRN